MKKIKSKMSFTEARDILNDYQKASNEQLFEARGIFKAFNSFTKDLLDLTEGVVLDKLGNDYVEVETPFGIVTYDKKIITTVSTTAYKDEILTNPLYADFVAPSISGAKVKAAVLARTFPDGPVKLTPVETKKLSEKIE